MIRNLAPENPWWFDGIHGSDMARSWERDAANNPALAQQLAALSRFPAEELYDLQADPLETNSLAAGPAYAKTKARLQAELDAWMRQQGDRGMATELAAPWRRPRNAPEGPAARSAEKRKKDNR